MTVGERSNGQEAGALQGVGRALDILECVAAEGAMSATEVVQALGFKWATAHRTLRYLVDRGYLSREDHSGVYSIGPRAYSVGGKYVANLPLVQIVRGHLPEAVAESGAIAQLVARDGDESIVLSAVEPLTGAVPQASVGHNFPLNCSSKGHVLLAWESPAMIEEFLSKPLRSLTPHTITDPDVLRARLEQVRRRGYAVTSRDTRLFSGSVSAPIRDRAGQVVACLCLVVPAGELADRRIALQDIVMRRVESISLMLGWRPLAASAGNRAGGAG